MAHRNGHNKPYNGQKSRNLGGWLPCVVMLLFYSLASAMYFIYRAVQDTINMGINSILFLTYLFLVFYIFFGINALLLIISRKRRAVLFSVIAISIGMFLNLWYLLFQPLEAGSKIIFGLVIMIANWTISLAAITYLIQSRIAKEVLCQVNE
jgi:hypothetical protein